MHTHPKHTRQNTRAQNTRAQTHAPQMHAPKTHTPKRTRPACHPPNVRPRISSAPPQRPQANACIMAAGASRCDAFSRHAGRRSGLQSAACGSAVLRRQRDGLPPQLPPRLPSGVNPHHTIRNLNPSHVPSVCVIAAAQFSGAESTHTCLNSHILVQWSEDKIKADPFF